MLTDFNNIDHTEFQKHLLLGNFEKCSEIIKTLVDKDIEIKLLYEDIIKKSLYGVGELWENGKISVSTEHLASAIVETIMSEVYVKISEKHKLKKTVVVTCTENEFHQIGLKMVSDVFELNGWRVIFLGANTSTELLVSQLNTSKPDILVISLSIPFNMISLEKMLSEINRRFPDLHILIGGQAFLHGGLDILKKYKKVVYLPDLPTLDSFLKTNI